MHALRVGEVEGAEHGAEHARRRAAEWARAGRARASEEGAGSRPRPRAMAGGCACCGAAGGCTPRHVLLGECGASGVDWPGYLAKLAAALRVVEKAVPRVPLEAGTPLAAWCPCRPVVRAAAEALRYLNPSFVSHLGV